MSAIGKLKYFFVAYKWNRSSGKSKKQFAFFDIFMDRMFGRIGRSLLKKHIFRRSEKSSPSGTSMGCIRERQFSTESVSSRGAPHIHDVVFDLYKNTESETLSSCGLLKVSFLFFLCLLMTLFCSLLHFSFSSLTLLDRWHSLMTFIR